MVQSATMFMDRGSALQLGQRRIWQADSKAGRQAGKQESSCAGKHAGKQPDIPSSYVLGQLCRGTASVGSQLC